jgi:hypothetical protein
VWIERNGSRLKEFPINVVNFLGQRFVFSGGGYFRLLPYGVLKRFMEKSPYVMTYFHPRDFDPEQPLIRELPLHRRFKSYYGLNGAYRKLQRLINDYRFIDVATADSNTDWARARRVKM